MKTLLSILVSSSFLAAISHAESVVIFNDIAALISEIVRERGALIVLDRRDVFLSADRIDITDDAIARINAASDP